MALARWALRSREWTAYERARDVAIQLVLAHRVEDEISRFRQVSTACTGCLDRGDDARELIKRRLTNAFQEGTQGRDSAHELLVRMHRIPRAAATAALLSGIRRGDGELCIRFLLFEDGQIADDIRAAFGDDPAQIAARFTDRHWADFARPLLAISPGELRQDMIVEARKSLRRTLSAIARR
ncbi:MAG: hypothetical protein ABSH51_28785 [Solirubrobacteraceae bacterium]